MKLNFVENNVQYIEGDYFYIASHIDKEINFIAYSYWCIMYKQSYQFWESL